MFNKDIYEAANDDVFARYEKDKDSVELLRMRTFLSNINKGYIKNKKDAQEEFKTVKRNVKRETLKEIVKQLEFGIFGPDDDDGDDDDDKDDKDDRMGVRNGMAMKRALERESKIKKPRQNK